MKIIMTIGGVNCNAQVLLNELTCRIPKGLVIPSTGLPVRVREPAYDSSSSNIKSLQIKCNYRE